MALHQKFVMNAGGTLQVVDTHGNKLAPLVSPDKQRNHANGSESNDTDNTNIVVAAFELSPLVTYAGEGLKSILDGKTFTMPTCSIGLDAK